MFESQGTVLTIEGADDSSWWTLVGALRGHFYCRKGQEPAVSTEGSWEAEKEQRELSCQLQIQCVPTSSPDRGALPSLLGKGQEQMGWGGEEEERLQTAPRGKAFFLYKQRCSCFFPGT